jgi:hypothetical protein
MKPYPVASPSGTMHALTALLAPAALLALVAGGWCAAMAMFATADFGRAPAYVEDSSKSDMVWGIAASRAMADGQNSPFFWKTVSRLNAPFEANWSDWPSLDELHGLVLVVAANDLWRLRRAQRHAAARPPARGRHVLLCRPRERHIAALVVCRRPRLRPRALYLRPIAASLCCCLGVARAALHPRVAVGGDRSWARARHAAVPTGDLGIGLLDRSAQRLLHKHPLPAHARGRRASLSADACSAGICLRPSP